MGCASLQAVIHIALASHFGLSVVFCLLDQVEVLFSLSKAGEMEGRFRVPAVGQQREKERRLTSVDLNSCYCRLSRPLG